MMLIKAKVKKLLSAAFCVYCLYMFITSSRTYYSSPGKKEINPIQVKISVLDFPPLKRSYGSDMSNISKGLSQVPVNNLATYNTSRHSSLARSSHNDTDDTLQDIDQIGRMDQTDGISRMSCEKLKHFVLIKTEKTGSSTLFSLLARYILTNKLNVMVMTFGGHLDVTKLKGAAPGWDIGPKTNKIADCLIHHSRYNESLHQYIAPDAKFITLVRDAETWFQSAADFWPNMLGFQSAERVLQQSPSMIYLPRTILNDDYNGMKTVFHLSQLQWLGFDYSKRNDVSAIKGYINDIISKISIKFITDQFDASLVIMKRRFCWDHHDIYYQAKEVRGPLESNHRRPRLSKEARERLMSPEYNLGEELLYEAFNRSWWNQPEMEDPDFWREVEKFKENNLLVLQHCKNVTKGGTKDLKFTIPASPWSPSFTLDQSYCRLILIDNYELITVLATYAIGPAYQQHFYSS